MSLYGSLGQYFGQSGGTGSPGKSGGAGYSSDATASSNGSGDSQANAPTSGSGGLFSAALGLSSTDKSAFSTTFSQQFGGITNNQIVNSPGATGASMPYGMVASPTAPINAAPSGMTSTVLVLVVAAVLAALIVKRI